MEISLFKIELTVYTQLHIWAFSFVVVLDYSIGCSLRKNFFDMRFRLVKNHLKITNLNYETLHTN